MKKLLLWGIVLSLSLIFAGCDVATTSPKQGTPTTLQTTADDGTTEDAVTTALQTTAEQENTDVDQVMSLLIAAGYALDERDAESVAYYNSHAVNETYGISVTVLEVYLGYVNQVERWAELIGFGSVADAQTYTGAIDAQDTSGLLYYRLGTAVVITYSQDTIDALS